MKAIEKNLYLGRKGVLYADWTFRGRRTRKSLKTRNLKEARATLKRLKRGETNPKISWGEPPTPKSLGVGDGSWGKGAIPKNLGVANGFRPSLELALDDFIENTSFGSPETDRNLRTCRSIFDRLCSDWETFRPVQVWKAYANKGHISAPNQLRWFIRKFVRYCLERSWVEEVIWRECKSMPLKVVSSRQVEIPPSTLVGDFLRMCVAHDLDRGEFICWLAYSALRIKGASGLKWEEVSFNAGHYRRTMKGGKKVFIPLLPEAVDLLRRRWDRSGRPSHGPVWDWEYGLDNEFKKVRGIMRRFAKGLEIGLTYPHALRHHLASVALAGGFSAAEVALMLGHQDNGALVLKTYGHVIRSVLDRKVAQLRIASAG